MQQVNNQKLNRNASEKLNPPFESQNPDFKPIDTYMTELRNRISPEPCAGVICSYRRHLDKVITANGGWLSVIISND